MTTPLVVSLRLLDPRAPSPTCVEPHRKSHHALAVIGGTRSPLPRGETKSTVAVQRQEGSIMSRINQLTARLAALTAATVIAASGLDHCDRGLRPRGLRPRGGLGLGRPQRGRRINHRSGRKGLRWHVHGRSRLGRSEGQSRVWCTTTPRRRIRSAGRSPQRRLPSRDALRLEQALAVVLPAAGACRLPAFLAPDRVKGSAAVDAALWFVTARSPLRHGTWPRVSIHGAARHNAASRCS